jgi:prepilin peptidase CpaA
MSALPSLMIAPVLVWIAWTDFRLMRISNAAVLAAVAIFALTIPLIGWSEAGLRLVVALAVFAAGFALFALRVVRGGDVKMAAALMLFVPFGTYAQFALLFALALLVGIAVIQTLRLTPMTRTLRAVSSRASGDVPVGLAIALSGLLHFGVLTVP